MAPRNPGNDPHNRPQSTPRRDPAPRDADGTLTKYERKAEAREDARLTGELKSSRARVSAEKLVTRSTTGFIYALSILICLFWGPIPTAVLMAAMAWLCCSEFFRICRMLGRMPNEFVGLIATVLFPFLPLLSVNLEPTLIFLLIIAAGIWYVATPRVSIADVAVTVFGPLYTGFLISAVTSIRVMGGDAQPQEVQALLTLGVMGSIWANDAAAYLVGSRIGKHKMVPKISPNKSWEGFVGGIGGSLILWMAMWVLHLPGVSLPVAIVGALVVGCVSVMGDLVESKLKRSAGVKDSGNVLPGHGGLLDRSDSLLFGSMTAYLILVLGGLL